LKNILFFISYCFIAWFLPFYAVSEPADPVKTTLRKSLDAMATLQKDGGWAVAWSGDGTTAFSADGIQENELAKIYLPSTSRIGMTFLRAYQLLQDEHYLEVAQQTGDALVQGQLDCGGFPKSMTPDTPQNIPGSFEDGATPYAARLLAELWKITNDQKYADAAQRCAEFMLQAQDEHGGFPQRYPLSQNEPRHIVLQGGATTEAIRSLLYCYQTFGNQEYHDAVIRGLDCLRALRGEPPQAGWAQVYTEDGNPIVMEPCHSTAISTVDTVAVMQLFMEYCVATGDKTYLRSIPATVDWLKHSKLENGKWAGFYEYGSNQVLDCPNDNALGFYGTYYFQPEANGQGEYYNQEIDTLFWILYDVAPDIIQSEYRKSLRGFKHRRREQNLPVILHALNDDGYWVSPLPPELQEQFAEKLNPDQNTSMIHALVFVRNVNEMLDSLESGSF
jgi:rhamnogalacturonyl hydrolase YesR